MSTQQILKDIQALPLDEQREIALSILQSLSEVSEKSDDAMNMREFLARLDAAEADIRLGNTYTSTEIRNRIQKWK